MGGLGCCDGWVGEQLGGRVGCPNKNEIINTYWVENMFIPKKHSERDSHKIVYYFWLG